MRDIEGQRASERHQWASDRTGDAFDKRTSDGGRAKRHQNKKETRRILCR